MKQVASILRRTLSEIDVAPITDRVHDVAYEFPDGRGGPTTRGAVSRRARPTASAPIPQRGVQHNQLGQLGRGGLAAGRRLIGASAGGAGKNRQERYLQ